MGTVNQERMQVGLDAAREHRSVGAAPGRPGKRELAGLNQARPLCSSNDPSHSSGLQNCSWRDLQSCEIWPD